MKRILDLAFVIVLAPIWLPALAFVAVAVRIGMGSPVMFRQRRAGLRGRPFTILKFRTMREGDGGDDERLTPFGRFLRATSLDELPQLLNVLKGEMSIVGPRPLLVEYLPRYSPTQARRHEVRPGITGWAQVNGRNAVDWQRKFELDVWYVDNRSLWLDVKILFMTVVSVFVSKGVESPESATPGPFMGNESRNEA